MKRTKVSVHKHTLQFKFKAKTSRNTLLTKDSWIVRITDETSGKTGLGECSPIWGLSPENPVALQQHLARLLAASETLYAPPPEVPSLKFAIECARIDLKKSGKNIYSTPYTSGKVGIPINGLIWMNDLRTMKAQIREKLDAGFRCLKLKVGALDTHLERELLKEIRKEYAPDLLELRLDANGAFTGENVEEVLHRFASFHIHSIEQPLAPGQWELMAEVVQKNIVDIALDEELIGITEKQERDKLLQIIRPKYLILKPSLLGGFASCEDWISRAANLGVKWWTTSMLESDIGLNAISQWTSSLDNPLRHGLGTGQLFSNNFESPLEIRGEELWLNSEKTWNYNTLFHSEII